MIFDARHVEHTPGVCRCGRPILRRDVKVYCSERCRRRAHRLRQAGVRLDQHEGVCPVDGVRFDQPADRDQPATCSPSCARDAAFDTPYMQFRRSTETPRRKWRGWLAKELRCDPELPALEDVVVALARANKLNAYLNRQGRVVEVGRVFDPSKPRKKWKKASVK